MLDDRKIGTKFALLLNYHIMRKYIIASIIIAIIVWAFTIHPIAWFIVLYLTTIFIANRLISRADLEGYKRWHNKGKSISDEKIQNEFNAVFSNSAIHWIKKQEMIYELIYNSLKDNGRIQIQTGLKKINPYSQALINVGIEYREYLKNFKPPWRFLTKQETEKILRELNFKNISVEIYPYIAKFDTIAGIGNYFKAAGFVPFSEHLPKHLHNEFIEKFKKEILKINQPNPLELKMDRLFISAKKIL